MREGMMIQEEDLEIDALEMVHSLVMAGSKVDACRVAAEIGWKTRSLGMKPACWEGYLYGF